MTDSTSPRFFMLDSFLSVIVLSGNFFVQWQSEVNLSESHFEFFDELVFLYALGNFDSLDILINRGFLIL